MYRRVYMSKLEKPLNSSERYLYGINERLDTLIDMLGELLESPLQEDVEDVINELEGQISIYEDVDYNEFTVNELKSMLDEFDIEYKANMRKSELINLILQR